MSFSDGIFGSSGDTAIAVANVSAMRMRGDTIWLPITGTTMKNPPIRSIAQNVRLMVSINESNGTVMVHPTSPGMSWIMRVVKSISFVRAATAP